DGARHDPHASRAVMGGRSMAGTAEDPVGTMAQPASESRASASAQVRHRIFIAVALAPALRHTVAGLEPRFSAAAKSLRWVAPDHLHFTLKFLGEITGAEVARAGEAARQVGAKIGRASCRERVWSSGVAA